MEPDPRRRTQRRSRISGERTHSAAAPATTALVAAGEAPSQTVAGVEVPHPTKRAKMAKMLFAVGLVLSLAGISMAWGALIIEQTRLVPLQESYFEDHTKTERDDAAAGSQLNQDLAEIQTLKPTILTLKLVGIATILFGIVILLGGILRMMSMVPESLSVYFRSALDAQDRGTSHQAAEGSARARGQTAGTDTRPRT